ncbi:MAG: threonine/serine dehydratase [Alphaproteobacteria bacterium]|nr:threonine/serine dehydratase [Alphaproteobacteria bacterium]
MDVVAEVEAAERRIRPHVRETPLVAAADSGAADMRLFYKCENLQATGSFKARGALSKLLSLSGGEIGRGIVTASTGNHGAATAFAARRVGARAIVYVPEGASPAKLAAIERLGGEIRRHGVDSVESELKARAVAEETGAVFVSPYNDPQVVGGQGTIGVELARALDRFDVVYVAVGGGGLIGGIAGWLKARRPATRIVGVQPENSQVMRQSVLAGRMLELPSLPTLSDGTAGGVELDTVTFPLVRDRVDEIITVTEDEIVAAMRGFMAVEHMMIEGAAGAALAGMARQRASLAGRTAVVVLCGANIALDKLKAILP